MSLNLKSLIGKLTEASRRALEGAAGLCMSRTHYEVEMEHWVAKLAESADGDIARILRAFDIEPDRFLRDMNRALEKFRTGNSRRPDLSESIEDIAKTGWVLASVNYHVSRVRSGVLFLAALEDQLLGRRLREISPDIAKINLEKLAQDLPKIVAGAPEDREMTALASAAERAPLGGAAEGAAGGPTPALDQYTIDLTAAAAAGKIDPVLGRDPEIRQIIDILTRRRQNNPILTGEAGVGKTAVVEGFALRIAAGDIPEILKNVVVRSLDLGLLQAGAGVKGEFENRLKQVIEEVRSSSRPVILFIDEAHTLIGAGGQEGQNDAANLLKPALARGELRTIAATTWAEYKKYFEKDAALTRRFQVVKVEEPSEDAAISMMRGVAPKLETHHRVRIMDEAVVESVRLSRRYIPARQLPDKSVSVLDTACAKVAIGVAATPAQIEDRQRTIQSIDREIEILEREAALGGDHRERLEQARASKDEVSKELAQLEEKWKKEREIVEKIAKAREGIEKARSANSKGDGDPAIEGMRRDLATLKEELVRAQGETALVHAEVGGQAVAAVISSWTGIPVGRMVADEIQTLLDLGKKLQARVIGQDHALEAIAQRIRTSRAKLENPNKPVGVFLLVGPSGVGKTETALTLAETLYGGEHNLITINMSEYQESHTVSSLKGSPPGYVGYGEGGVLTEAVRRRPYSVVLLDEVEKAHPDVMELFFQVFDKGMLEDGEGREIDFKNTIILLTSNVGSDTIMKLSADPQTAPEADALAEAIRPELLKAFPAALLGRMITVAYYPIGGEVLQKIIRLQLDRIARRIRENHQAELMYGEDLVKTVAARCTESASGARNVDAILTRSLLPEISREFLSRMVRGEAYKRVEVGVDGNGQFSYSIL